MIFLGDILPSCHRAFYLLPGQFPPLARLPLKYTPQRHQRIALLGNLSGHLVDFLLVKQQLAHTQRILVENIALFVRADVHTVDHTPPRFRCWTKDSLMLHFPIRRDFTSVP